MDLNPVVESGWAVIYSDKTEVEYERMEKKELNLFIIILLTIVFILYALLNVISYENNILLYNVFVTVSLLNIVLRLTVALQFVLLHFNTNPYMHNNLDSS